MNVYRHIHSTTLQNIAIVVLYYTFRGKFGRVLKCRDWDSGEVFAAKFVLCTKREDRRNVEREIEIMNALKNPKLLRLFDAYDNGRNETTLIME